MSYIYSLISLRVRKKENIINCKIMSQRLALLENMRGMFISHHSRLLDHDEHLLFLTKSLTQSSLLTTHHLIRTIKTLIRTLLTIKIIQGA